MSAGKYGIFLLALLDFIDQSDSLKALPKVEDNNIKTTAEIIRSTANNIFLAFKLKSKKDNPRLQYFSILHNYLTSQSLHDYTTLREIAKLTRVDKAAINNRTADFIVDLNEIVLEFSDDSKHEVYANGSSPIKEYIEKIWSIRNSKTDGESEHANTTVSPEHNVTLKEWTPDPILSNNRRIYNGRINKIRYFPFMVSVHVMNKFACGGSILKSDLIITAASCLQLAYNNKYFREKPDFLSVRVGSTFYGVGGELIDVLKIYFHPNYVPKFLHHNLAIMRLVRRITFWKHRSVKKIKFDMDDQDLAANINGIIIIGWGATTQSDSVKSPWVNRLSAVKLESYPYTACQAHYGKDFVTKTNFCLGYFTKGEGACNKDAGGPAIFNGVLMGVISFGASKCGTPDSPTVITKLGFYKKWITKIIAKQSVPKSDNRTTAIPKQQTPIYPPKNLLLKTTTKREISNPKFKARTTKSVGKKAKAAVGSAENIEAFNNLIDQMFPKIEVQKSIMRTKELVSGLQPRKHRAKKVKNIKPVKFTNDEDNMLPQFTYLYDSDYMTSKFTNKNKLKIEFVTSDRLTQKPPSSSLQTAKKYLEVLSNRDGNDVYANFKGLAISKPTYFKTVTHRHFNPIFRDLLIENVAPSDPDQKTSEADFPNSQNQQADYPIPESVIVSVTEPPEESVPLELYDEKPTTKDVKLVQTDSLLPMIDFDGDRTGLKSHLYDRNKIFNNIVNSPIIKGDFKELVITDPPGTSSPDPNAEFSYQRDILPLLIASKIPIFASPEQPKRVMGGGRDFGLPEMEMFDHIVPYNKKTIADKQNLPVDGGILRHLYDSGSPMKELQDVLLFHSSNPSTTTENIDLSIFMLPEKRRQNKHQNSSHHSRPHQNRQSSKRK